MPDTQSQIINQITSFQAVILRRENALAREIVRAYEAARRDLLARFADQFAALGDSPSPADIRRLANDASLIWAIDARLAELASEMDGLTRIGLTDMSYATYQQVGREILILAEALDVNFLPFAIDPLLELTIGPALDQIPGLIDAMRASISGTMREMLASGDRFSSIIRAVYGQNGSVFARGRTSAELMIRRAIIQAENNSRMLFYEAAKRQIPDLKKQAIASISARTTNTCLRVHGQIRELEQPFHISGPPSFGDRQMMPPFHWNCRSSVAAYHPMFERSSSVTTPAMIAAAQAELNNR